MTTPLTLHEANAIAAAAKIVKLYERDYKGWTPRMHDSWRGLVESAHVRIKSFTGSEPTT